MVAGSESGAILASTLAIKNDNESLSQPNKFYADKIVKFYEKEMNSVYKDNGISTGYYLLIVSVSGLIFGLISFIVTRRIFNVNGFEDQFKES